MKNVKEKEFHWLKKIEHPGSDHDARWVKKSGKTIYAYKKHIATDYNAMIMGVSHTTGANEHDSKGLLPLISKIPLSQRKEVMGRQRL